jgi:hypothetical protein
MFSKQQIVTAVLLSVLIVFSFAYVSAAEEKPAAETKVASETAKAAVAEEKPTGDFIVAAISQYIWRGYESFSRRRRSATKVFPPMSGATWIRDPIFRERAIQVMQALGTKRI